MRTCALARKRPLTIWRFFLPLTLRVTAFVFARAASGARGLPALPT